MTLRTKMLFSQTEIPDVIEIAPKVFADERGFFFESFNSSRFANAIGEEIRFLQDNHSRSVQGVIRGLHYQLPPFAQGKLIRVVSGEVFDVAVDIRRSSPTFGRWVGRFISAENQRQLWIPAGFAHGFLTLSESAEFLYKTTQYYAPDSERCIAWDDPQLQIQWPTEGLVINVSQKDLLGRPFVEAEIFP